MTHMKIAATALAIALLAACSKSAPNTSSPTNQPSLSGALSPSAVQQAAQAAKTAVLPQPDWGTPDSAYNDVEKPIDVLYLDAALSGLPPNYDRLAKLFSSDYANTTDAFKQHDLLAAIQPKLDAGIAAAKTHPYIMWTDDRPDLGHYDFNTHTFPVTDTLFQQGGYLRFYQDYEPWAQITVNNGSDFQSLKVADEAKARTIESAHGRKFKIFAFAQATDDSGTPAVKVLVTKIQLLDGQGQVLFEQAATH